MPKAKKNWKTCWTNLPNATGNPTNATPKPTSTVKAAGKAGIRLRLQQALAAQGVDEAISRSLMPRREDELRTAVAILRKKFRQSAADLKEKQKQARFLTYRGFDADTVQTALKTAWDENNGYGEDSF